MKKSVIVPEILNAISAEYEKIYKKGSKMYKHCMKDFSVACPVNSGDYFFVFKKPVIKTDFYFGSSDFGQGPSHEEACNLANHAVNDGGKYFKKHNLKQVDYYINLLESDKKLYFMRSYFNKDVKIVFFEPQPIFKKNIVVEMSSEDRQAVLEMMKEERNKFEKRLNTYLKRYGTTKLTSKTYWIDE